MYKKFLEDFIINESKSVTDGFWQVNKNNMILIVVDNDDKFIGVLTRGDFEKIKYNRNVESIKVGELCNRKCKHLVLDNNEDIYIYARNLFVQHSSINYVPVLDNNNNIVDIFSRERAFYHEYFKKNKLPRMHYATCIYNAAYEAKKIGYDAISVIEFGVGGGSGLVTAEFHAREIEKILEINIEVYGFDNICGLPENMEADYRNVPYYWTTGAFCMMDNNYLEQNLQRAKLIVGDIKDTGLTFFKSYSPAPIGAMFVDVDIYTSTLPILNMLELNDDYFLPRVYMYFDDLLVYNEFLGEQLCIREFNNRNENLKISPEGIFVNSEHEHVWLGENWDFSGKIKKCHRFKHPLYSKNIYADYYKDNGLGDYVLPLIRKTI
jgi:hypothetical protein